MRAVSYSVENARWYAPDEMPPLPERRLGRAEIAVTRHKSFEAALARHERYPDEHIAVLNFASAVNPGGGVKHGARAQEESLCRCSTLYPSLDQSRFWEKYYYPNRAAGDPSYTDACIYSPGVVICKTDDAVPQRMPSEDHVTVDVVTCAAPNLRTDRYGSAEHPSVTQLKQSREALYALHLRRAGHIMHIAAANGADALILGAFGCGAFCNDPWVVAPAWRDALAEYAAYFSYVEFAVYCTDLEMDNYIAFRDTF